MLAPKLAVAEKHMGRKILRIHIVFNNLVTQLYLKKYYLVRT
jgi:hypothetical protein